MEFVQYLCMYPTTIKKVIILITLALVFDMFMDLSWLILFLPGKKIIDVLKLSFIISLLGIFEPLLYTYFTGNYILYLAFKNKTAFIITISVSMVVMTILFIYQKYQLLLIYNIILAMITIIYENKNKISLFSKNK